jgi:hypothetical protein
MTRKMTKLPFPYALVSSTLGTVLVSMTAVWLAAATYTPLNAPDAEPSHSTGSHQLYQLSPIPPGADWTNPLPRSPSLEPAPSRRALFFGGQRV